MKKELIILLLLITIFSFSCKKTDSGQTAKIDVTVITETDNFGTTLSQIDNSDWTNENTWTNEEFTLLQTPSVAQLGSSEKAIITVWPGFPNPTSGIIIFAANISKPTLVQIVIVDNMLSLKDRYFLANSNNNLNLFTFSLDASKYSNNTNYRIYYGFYSLTDGLYYKGHGDLKIAR